MLQTPGRVVQHARQLVLRRAATAAQIAEWIEALRLLPVPV